MQRVLNCVWLCSLSFCPHRSLPSAHEVVPWNPEAGRLVDAQIAICELVNMFPALAFPNPSEMHSYIRFGIRPLLYSVLRREFLQPRDVGICANTQCRDFFDIERAGQQYCNEVCSRRQRQSYKSRFQYSDAEYFNLSDKDTRIATARQAETAGGRAVGYPPPPFCKVFHSGELQAKYSFDWGGGCY
jgi:hypothetical protein